VKDLESGRVEITAQNHGFAVDPTTLPADVVVDRINLNDQTVEGMRHKTKPIFWRAVSSRGFAGAARFHWVVCPVPHDDRKEVRRTMDWLSNLIWHNGTLFGIHWGVWKVIGWLGNAVFFSRFFVQWYATEKLKRVVVRRRSGG